MIDLPSDEPNAAIDELSNTRITFVGAGNMARSMIAGVLRKGVAPKQLCASAPSASSREQLSRDYGIHVEADNIRAVAEAQCVVLAVKPAMMAEVCRELRGQLPVGTLVISVAAGIDVDSIAAWIGTEDLVTVADEPVKEGSGKARGMPVVRCMPNTPAKVMCGASGLYANAYCSEAHKRTATALMTSIGIAVWLESETLVDAVTAVSGSGPAYIFMFIESMIDAGVALGLDRKSASLLAKQTAYGAAQLACHSEDDVAQLRAQVTSKGGTTAQAIETFEHGGLRELVTLAMQKCFDKAQAIAVQHRHA